MLDASAFIGTLADPLRYPELGATLADDATDIAVPHLCDVEVAAGVRRIVRSGLMTADRAGQALALYAELPLQRFPHPPLLQRAFGLRENFTAHDAVYVALAEGLGAPLHTGDARLARAARAHTDLEVVEV